MKFDNNYQVDDEIKKQNKLDSDLVLWVSNDKYVFLILFGWVYASEPGLCTIIDLSSGEVVYNDHEDLKSINLEKGTMTLSYSGTIECSELINNN